MANGLKPLIRFNRRQLDDKQRALAALRTQRDALEAEFAQLETSLTTEADAARGFPDFAFAFANYAQSVRMQQKQILEQMTLLDGQIETALDDIRTAFREVKTYEIAQENRDKAEKLALAQKENAEMDEVAIGLTQRRKQELASDS